MKPILNTPIEFIFSWCLIAISFLLPIHTGYTGIFMVTAFIIWLWANHFRISFLNKVNRNIFFSCIALALVYAAALFYSANQNEAVRKLVLRISMFIFPLVFLAESKIKLPKINTLLTAFIAGGILCALLLIIHGGIIYLKNGENLFATRRLTIFLKINPAYLSLYFVLMISILAKNISLSNSIIKTSCYVAAVLLFIFMIFILAARQQIFILLLLLILLPPTLIVKKKKILITLYSGLIVASLIALLFLFPSTKSRLENIGNEISTPYSYNTVNSINERIVIWKAASKLFFRQPIFGYGTGDDNDVLFQEYKIEHLDWPLTDRLNAHNQLLQTSLATGILGIFFLLMLFAVSLYHSIKGKNFLLGVFITSFILSTLTESMFETEAGVVYFSLFNSIMLAAYLKQRSSNREQANNQKEFI
ncbi:MAG: O-antigen ligase family protein [Chitinophagales bacterium]|nr:O-antigen ligase family protein [Chitinophagales bacterium]